MGKDGTGEVVIQRNLVRHFLHNANSEMAPYHLCRLKPVKRGWGANNDGLMPSSGGGIKACPERFTQAILR